MRQTFGMSKSCLGEALFEIVVLIYFPSSAAKRSLFHEATLEPKVKRRVMGANTEWEDRKLFTGCLNTLMSVSRARAPKKVGGKYVSNKWCLLFVFFSFCFHVSTAFQSQAITLTNHIKLLIFVPWAVWLLLQLKLCEHKQHPLWIHKTPSQDSLEPYCWRCLSWFLRFCSCDVRRVNFSLEFFNSLIATGINLLGRIYKPFYHRLPQSCGPLCHSESSQRSSGPVPFVIQCIEISRFPPLIFYRSSLLDFTNPVGKKGFLHITVSLNGYKNSLTVH